MFCRDKHVFVAKKLFVCLFFVLFLSRKKYACRDNLTFVRVCLDKRFVATKMILVAVPANDTDDGRAHRR